MVVTSKPLFSTGRVGGWRAMMLALPLASLAVMGIGPIGEAHAVEQQPAYVIGDETADMAALRARLTRLYDARRPPAMQVAIISEGRKVEFGFGEIDRRSGLALRQDHVFRFGSITKLLVASAFIHALQEHGIDVDEPVSARFPDRGLPAGVTYRQVLQHTSSLPDILDAPAFGEALESDPSRVWTPDELWAVAAALPPRSEPWR